MVRFAYSQFINTSLMLFVLNWDHPVLRQFGVVGRFRSFERGWYSMVGSSLIITMMLNSVCPAFTHLLQWLLKVVQRPCCRCRAKHQVELLRLYTNPPFDLATRYAQLMATCLCTLIFSSGLPIVNWAAVAFFFLSYWIDKLVLLRGSLRPLTASPQCARESSRVLTLAVPIHCFAALFMLSHTCTFPSSTAAGPSAAKGTGITNILASVASHESTWMFLALLLVYILIEVIEFVFFIVGGAFSDIVAMCKNQQVELAKVLPDDTAPSADDAKLSWDEARKIIKQLRPPASYRLESHPLWKELLVTSGQMDLLKDDPAQSPPQVHRDPVEKLSDAGQSDVEAKEATVCVAR